MLLAPLITHSNEQPLGKLWSALYIQCSLEYMVRGDEEKVPTQRPELAPWITYFLFHLFLNHATCWVLWLMGAAAGCGLPCGVQAWGRYSQWTCQCIGWTLLVSFPRCFKHLFASVIGHERDSLMDHQPSCLRIQGCSINPNTMRLPLVN